MIDPLETLLVNAEWHAVELKRDRGGDYLQESETGNGITLAELVKRYNALLRSPASAATVTGETWAGALMATRTRKFHVEAECVSVVIAAQDEGKANVTATNMCHERWPDADGWINHSQCVVAVPRLTPPAQGDEMRALVDDLTELAKSWERVEGGVPGDVGVIFTGCAIQLRSAVAAVREGSG